MVSQNWLGENTIFYNSNGLISNKINDLIDIKNFEFDEEGLTAYLNYGYCVFGRTPIRGIFFLRPNQKLEFVDSKIRVKNNADPTIPKLGVPTKETAIWDLIRNKLQIINENKNVIIPLSGGLDSRILTYFSKELDNFNSLESFSYGISWKQSDSYEAKISEEVAQRLNIKWKRIHLDNINNYIDDWASFFGISSHYHGMYHFEFYNKIKLKSFPGQILSGILGDIWAGSYFPTKPKTPMELILLGYSHGLNLDSSVYLNENLSLFDSEFESEKELLDDLNYRILYLARNKIMLLKYLIKVPTLVGFEVNTPFLDMDIVTAMLSLDIKRRLNRSWQRDFLQKKNLDTPQLEIKGNMRNSLDFFNLQSSYLKPLNEELMSRHFSNSFIKKVNYEISKNYKFSNKLIHMIKQTKYIGYGINKLGYKRDILTYYYNYLILRPINDLLELQYKIQNTNE